MTFPRLMHPARVFDKRAAEGVGPYGGDGGFRKNRCPVARLTNGTSRTPSPTAGCEYRARRESAGGASPSPTGWCETNTGRRGRRPLRRGANIGRGANLREGQAPPLRGGAKPTRNVEGVGPYGGVRISGAERICGRGKPLPYGVVQNQRGPPRASAPTVGHDVSAKTVARLRNSQTGRRGRRPLRRGANIGGGANLREGQAPPLRGGAKPTRDVEGVGSYGGT